MQVCDGCDVHDPQQTRALPGRKYESIRRGVYDQSSPERNRHAPGMFEYISRLVGFGMEFGAQRERLRLWPARSYDDTDPRPSRDDPMGQVRPAHRARHAHVGEKQPDVCGRFEKLQGLVGTSRFEHPVTCIREHVRCPHSFKYIVIDDHDERVGLQIGHHAVTFTSGNRSTLNTSIVNIYSNAEL
jgi:hypothetical protein